MQNILNEPMSHVVASALRDILVSEQRYSTILNVKCFEKKNKFYVYAVVDDVINDLMTIKVCGEFEKDQVTGERKLPVRQIAIELYSNMLIAYTKLSTVKKSKN